MALGSTGFERFELSVHFDPESLEGSLRRMAAGFAGSCRDGVVQQPDEPARRDERLALSLGDYPSSDPVGVPLLAVCSQDSGQLWSRIGIEDLSRSQLLASHPHVERGILCIGESASRIVDLERGDTEIEQNPLNLGTAQPGEYCRQLVVDRLNECDPVRKFRQPVARESQRLRIAIKSDELSLGAGSQQGMGVAAETDGAIDENAATVKIGGRCLQGRSQQCNDFRQHDGYVQLGQATHPTSRPFEL